jgi:predicted small secreted protein
MLKKLLAQLIAVSFIAGGVAVLGGCNTMEGAGKDIERGGQKMQNKAEDVKSNSR